MVQLRPGVGQDGAELLLDGGALLLEDRPVQAEVHEAAQQHRVKAPGSRWQVSQHVVVAAVTWAFESHPREADSSARASALGFSSDVQVPRRCSTKWATSRSAGSVSWSCPAFIRGGRGDLRPSTGMTSTLSPASLSTAASGPSGSSPTRSRACAWAEGRKAPRERERAGRQNGGRKVVPLHSTSTFSTHFYSHYSSRDGA